MIQKSYLVASEAELLGMIDQLKADLSYLKAKTKFAQFFLSRFDAVEAQTIVYVLKKSLPDIQIVGMSLYGDPFVGLNTAKTIQCNFCFFEASDVTVLTYDCKTMRNEDVTADFQKRLHAIPQAKGVLILASGIALNCSYFMEALTNGHDDIPFFGAVSNISTTDVGAIEPYAFGDSFVTVGLVVAIFSGEALHFYTESLLSWNPIGKEMTVTSCSQSNGVIGDTLIKTIDGIPATDIYKKYLNVEPDAHFISNICEFPLVLERNGCLMARIPCGYTESGELNTMGDIRNGEKVRLTYGKTDEILEKSKKASERLREFSPEAIFLYVCANRAIFLKDRAQEEINAYRDITPGMVFCHGFSELYRYKGQGGVFNSQLVTVGLREGTVNAEDHLDERVALMGVSFDTPQRKKALEPPPKTEHMFMGPGDSGMRDQLHTMFFDPIRTQIPLAERLVTFLEATTDELKNMTQAANAASEAKSAFLSSMSHEIRTPINAVLGLDEMILRESHEPAIKSYARDIQSSGKSLLSIVNDILDFSKIEAGKMEIINDDYDLRSTITDLANMIETRAHKKGLDFIVNVDTAMPHLLHGDETRIKQCALNILTNAVKYTAEGSVTLTVGYKKISKKRIALTFAISDTGIGIKEEDLEKLYKPFERIEESRNRSIEGTGLGMSIVNGLLTQMGAHLNVQSVYGKGSDFSFTVEQDVRDWEKIGTHEEARAALRAEVGSYQESFQAPDAHLLVVDDTPMNVTVIRGLLKLTRIKIDTASNADSALALARENAYDIICIDHLMPKKDGIQMLHELRADSTSKNQNTVCIALTANAVSGAKEMYLAAGFENYLAKPIDSKKLEAMIAHYLPPEKVILAGQKGFVAQKAGDWDGVERRQPWDGNERHATGSSDALFAELFGVDIGEALKNCGDKDTFMEALRSFYDAIDEKSAEIARYAAANDWQNYTVLVHALKSSARLIGATALSEEAKALEACGDAAKKGESEALATIAERTPALLSDYRAYKTKLAALCGAAPAAQRKETPAMQSLSKEKCAEALSALKEVLSAFDFSSADEIIKDVSRFKIPDVFAERFAKLKEKIRNVDQTGAMALLE